MVNPYRGFRLRFKSMKDHHLISTTEGTLETAACTRRQLDVVPSRPDVTRLARKHTRSGVAVVDFTAKWTNDANLMISEKIRIIE